MKIDYRDYKLLNKFKDDMRGVFTLSDIKNLFQIFNGQMFYRKLKELERAGVIKRFIKGIYISENFDMQTLSQKICPDSYISFENVLAKNMIIGTVPQNYLKAVKIGKKRIYKKSNLSIVHVGITPNLYFGFETVKGINLAVKEKAFLDTLYYYQKGMKFYFDIYSDMNIQLLDNKIVNKFLKKYENPKFTKFVEGFFK
jgi:hypothetical protein